MQNQEKETVWQGSSWRLQVTQLPLADGTVLEKGTIVHPGSVLLVPLRAGENGPEVLMLRQYRLALDTVILELPAGTREPDEPWLNCAQRELREETGFRADNFVSLGAVWPAPGLSDELMTVFLATELHEDPLPQDVDEDITVVPMSLEELVGMARDGRLQDAKSVVGILRTAVSIKASFL